MHKPLGMKISGTGRSLPDRVVPNSEFEKYLDTNDKWIRERTGIVERRFVSEGETTASLAVDASRKAIEMAGLTPDDIDLIIVATITPEAILPSTACFVQQELCSKPVPAFDLVAACSGFVYALINATAMVQTGAYKDRGTAILFGDGAGAAVISATPDAAGPALLHSTMSAEGSGDSVLFVPAGGSRVRTSQMTLDERLHYVKMNGREVYKRAVKRNHDLVDQTLSEAGVTADQIKLVIPHQSNLRIVESARERMGLAPDRMYTNIDKYGNTSGASIPICLDECMRAGRLEPGDLCLLIAFGAGFTWASALIRI